MKPTTDLCSVNGNSLIYTHSDATVSRGSQTGLNGPPDEDKGPATPEEKGEDDYYCGMARR